MYSNHTGVVPCWATPETARLAEVLNSILGWWADNGRDRSHLVPNPSDPGAIRAVIEQILTDGLDDRALIVAAHAYVDGLDRVDWRQVATAFGPHFRA